MRVSEVNDRQSYRDAEMPEMRSQHDAVQGRKFGIQMYKVRGRSDGTQQGLAFERIEATVKMTLGC